MELALKDKVVIVTGGSGGIGQAIVEKFAGEGATVVVADITDAPTPEFAAKLKSMGAKVTFMKVDVTSRSEVADLVARVIDKFGRIDVLANNAGFHRNLLLPDVTEADWNKVMDINTKGVYLFSQAVASHMIKARQGKIVNTASVAGREGVAGHIHYSASKFAVISMTQVLAKELGEHNINVNAVCPGPVLTPMMTTQLTDIARRENRPEDEVWAEFLASSPLGRAPETQDIANAILFLSSEIARNITGESINVACGIRMD